MRITTSAGLRAAVGFAVLGAAFTMQPAFAQDKTIRVGITLRMLVESGIAYGDIAKTAIESMKRGEPFVHPGFSDREGV